MKHLLWSLAALALLLGFAAETPAHAANCAGYTYTLTNGQTADATQVMSNFNTIMSCANSNLAKNGANSDITSLSGLATPLSPSQGGTGQSTSVFSSNNTWSGTNTFSSTLTGTLTGNASTSSKWAAAITLSLTGPVTGSASVDGSGAASIATSLAIPYATFQNQQTTGNCSNGVSGCESVGSDATQILNTSVNNTISGASLASNLMSLPAGTYQAHVRVPISSGANAEARCKLRNTTDSTDLLVGTTTYVLANTAGLATIDGAFVLSGTKSVAIQCRGGTTVGVAGANVGPYEVYEDVSLTKIG